MSLPRIATRDEWLAARKELLVKEKELTRRRDALNIERRNLPMVEVDKDYVFDGPQGEVRLIDMFEGRRQLIIYHFMFDPSWEDGCPSCTAGTDELSQGFLDHLHTRDTSYALVSRAPLAKLERWKAKRGWDLPWYSSYGSDFNYDFGVTIDESVRPGEYNFRTKAEFEALGLDFFEYDQPFEMPGRSCNTPGGWSRRVARTTSSISPPSAGRRSGRSPRVGPTRPARPPPTSPHDRAGLTSGTVVPRPGGREIAGLRSSPRPARPPAAATSCRRGR
jgi:predicted dithiol-disulfide oxidoreductase (DUF899 family)